MAELPGAEAFEMVPIGERAFRVAEIEAQVLFDASDDRIVFDDRNHARHLLRWRRQTDEEALVSIDEKDRRCPEQ